MQTRNVDELVDAINAAASEHSEKVAHYKRCQDKSVEANLANRETLRAALDAVDEEKRAYQAVEAAIQRIRSLQVGLGIVVTQNANALRADREKSQVVYEAPS